jgi:hypothetical protein
MQRGRPRRLRNREMTLATLSAVTISTSQPAVGADDTLLIVQRFAIYIVISMPNRKSIARGVSHFIRISYVYRIIRRRS